MSGKKLKHAVNSTGNPEDPKRRMIERITGMATLVILSIFPLVYHDFYFDILKTKYQFYYMTILLMMLALLAVSGYAAITRPVSGRTRQSLHSFVKKLTVPEWAMLSFLFVATCSTIFSEYRFEAFWGNEGRYTGLFLLLIYGLAFFAISRGLRFKSWYLDAFLAASMLVCLLGITDYFQLDLLHFKANMQPQQLNMFLSTLGNINTYTAYVALVLAISATLFATSRKWGYTIWYAVCMVISFFAIIMGNSDNAYLALAALFAFLPLYLFRTRGGITRCIIMGATFLTVVFCISRINAAMGDRVLGIDSLFSFIARFSGLLYVVIGLWILIMGLVAWEYR
ncbi:MAG: O-antigen ligase domain-containing protein, partial [Hungatella sp.]